MVKGVFIQGDVVTSETPKPVGSDETEVQPEAQDEGMENSDK